MSWWTEPIQLDRWILIIYILVSTGLLIPLLMDHFFNFYKFMMWVLGGRVEDFNIQAKVYYLDEDTIVCDLRTKRSVLSDEKTKKLTADISFALFNKFKDLDLDLEYDD